MVRAGEFVLAARYDSNIRNRLFLVDRATGEVRALMGLLRRYLRTELRRMMNYNIRLRAAGDLSRLPVAVRRALEAAGCFRSWMRCASRNLF